MNDESRRLRIGWIDKLREMDFPDRQASNEQFNREFDEMLDRLVGQVRERAPKMDKDTSNKGIIDKSLRDEGLKTLHERVRNRFTVANNERQKLRDLRKQEDWATSWDHLKFYLFRTITAFTIAAIILATSWLASYWQIPLPVMRVVPSVVPSSP